MTAAAVSPRARGARSTPPQPDLCSVLSEDPELAEWIPTAYRARAVQECLAPEVGIACGAWIPASDGRSSYGGSLLVLDGILIRRVALAGRCAAELLGEGDLLSLSEGEEIESRTLPVACGCSALKPARLAVLGPGFMLRARRYPELATALVERMTRRSHNLAVNMAIVHQPRIDVRLRLLLWHLAERWGRVRSDGTWLPLRLTHSVLGELVAARRPTVSKALMDLAKAGVLRQLRDGWVLYGEPPVAVHDPTLLHTEHVFR